MASGLSLASERYWLTNLVKAAVGVHTYKQREGPVFCLNPSPFFPHQECQRILIEGEIMIRCAVRALAYASPAWLWNAAPQRSQQPNGRRSKADDFLRHVSQDFRRLLFSSEKNSSRLATTRRAVKADSFPGHIHAGCCYHNPET